LTGCEQRLAAVRSQSLQPIGHVLFANYIIIIIIIIIIIVVIIISLFLISN